MGGRPLYHFREVAPYVPPTSSERDASANSDVSSDSVPTESSGSEGTCSDTGLIRDQGLPIAPPEETTPEQCTVPKTPVRRSMRKTESPKRFADSKYSCSTVLLQS